MVSKKVVVTNKTGLHARPASNLVAFCKITTAKFSCPTAKRKLALQASSTY